MHLDKPSGYQKELDLLKLMIFPTRGVCHSRTLQMDSLRLDGPVHTTKYPRDLHLVLPEDPSIHP